MAHILFIDSNECGLDGVRKAKELGHEVTFVESSVSHMYNDSPKNRALLESVDYLFVTPRTSDADAVIALLQDHVTQHPVDAAIAPFEGALEATSQICAVFGIPFSSTDAIGVARNKERAREFLGRAGLANARYRMAQSVDEALVAAEEIGFPVILKPKSGLDSIGVARVDTPEGLCEVAKKVLTAGDSLSSGFKQVKEQFNRGILVEQRLTGKMISVEIGIRGDETYVFMVSGRQNTEIDECLPMGVFMPSDLPDVDCAACVDYAERACRAFGLTFGLYHIEIMLTADGPVLVEANARLMGGIMPRIYRVATGGHAIEDALLRLHLGQKIETPLPKAQCTALVRRFIASDVGTIPESLSSARLAEFAGQATEFVNYMLTAGQALNRLDLLGRVIVLGSDFKTAAAKGDAMIAELESIIEVPLVRTAGDTWAPFSA